MNKVLLIEDDQIVANIYRNKLSVEGFTVEVANDGHSGLNAIREFQPDVVVLDLMLPKLSGVDVMKQVRANPLFQDLPIIVFSNTYLTNMVQEAWKAGATKCLSKANCSPKQLIEVIRSTLGTPGGSASIPEPRAQPASDHAELLETSQTISNNAPRAAAPRAPANEQDAKFQAELRKAFVEGMPATLSALRGLLQGMVKCDGEAARAAQVQEMYRRVHALTGNAGMSGMALIAQMSDALEALLKELYEKPKNLNTSTLRTVALTFDFLGVLFERSLRTRQTELPPASILVVDDEAISRRAVIYALEKAKLKSVSVEDPIVAYNLLLQQHFDLIVLDVDMPGMSGFELCSKLRHLPAHGRTPVVFVTSLNDLEARANSTMSGGNDFIAKPFLFIELAVKALVHVLRAKVTAGA
jgi:DNA-binding response OmpR family regulator